MKKTTFKLAAGKTFIETATGKRLKVEKVTLNSVVTDTATYLLPVFIRKMAEKTIIAL